MRKVEEREEEQASFVLSIVKFSKSLTFILPAVCHKKEEEEEEEYCRLRGRRSSGCLLNGVRQAERR